jgi:hypothetical protein
MAERTNESVADLRCCPHRPNVGSDGHQRQDSLSFRSNINSEEQS